MLIRLTFGFVFESRTSSEADGAADVLRKGAFVREFRAATAAGAVGFSFCFSLSVRARTSNRDKSSRSTSV